MSAELTHPLALAFLESAPVPADVSLAGLEDALGDAVRRGRAAWTQLELDPAVFARFLGARHDKAAPAIVWLGEVHVEDLYVACACVRGDPTALAAFERRYVEPLARILESSAALAGFSDEARQTLRVRLLVADEPGRPPRLANYRGHGPLSAWLRMTAMRMALHLRAASQRDPVPSDDDLLRAAPAREADPELLMLRKHASEVLASAMKEALGGLPQQERTILRLHFLDGVPAAAIGRMFGVSGRTIQRRVADARRVIVARTRTLLAARGVPPAQLETLMRLVDTDLQLSLQGILATHSDG